MRNFQLESDICRLMSVFLDSIIILWIKKSVYRALDKREYLMIIFSYFSSKPYVVIPHLNRLVEMVHMRGHNICFYVELTNNIPNYYQYSLLSTALCIAKTSTPVL